MRVPRGSFADAEARIPVELQLNGSPVSFAAPARRTLADALREELGATGVHLGCEHGVCGACTVLLDGEAVRSCLVLAVQADGCVVETVEGLAEGQVLAPLQQAFHEHHALQCGFCTPGLLLTATALVRHEPDADEARVREALAGNLCRCTGYAPIVAAVQSVLHERRT
ncbi:MAG TPA: (2Fe-2S)-binding protein [Gaiellaceae bacterium]|nr:(2Fe-2S)-binding protein [Gaiellaceae bacterium]